MDLKLRDEYRESPIYIYIYISKISKRGIFNFLILRLAYLVFSLGVFGLFLQQTAKRSIVKEQYISIEILCKY